MLFAMYSFEQIVWNLATIYGIYVIIKWLGNAAKSDAGKKAGKQAGLSLLKWLFK